MGNGWRKVAFLQVGLLAATCSGCLRGHGKPHDGGTLSTKDGGLGSPLVLSEVVAANEGVAIDEQGETDDFIELENRGTEAVDLSQYSIADASETPFALPNQLLEPGAVILLWADDDPEQGPLHLPFKLSADGDGVVLYELERVVERISFVNLADNTSLARFADSDDLASCRYPSPGKVNGPSCAAPKAPDLSDVAFESVTWPDPYPAVTAPLVIAEAALRPAGFVELLNRSGSALKLAGYSLWLAPTAPGEAWPQQGEGVALSLPDAMTLGAGERLVVKVDSADTAQVAARPEFEGVLSLFAEDGELLDRLDFMQWPQGASLDRLAADNGRFRFCTAPSEGTDGPCEPLASREVGDRLRHLRTPGDFAALASGDATLGVNSVKVIVDMNAGDVVHLLSASWPLHYTFVRERIYGEQALDRCDPSERMQFDAGWSAFSQTEYFDVEGRRFLLGTLSHHSGPNLRVLEYTFGDRISPAQMLHGFQVAVGHTEQPSRWALRPQDEEQVAKAREIEGQLPIVGPNAPFVGVEFQGLTQGVGFGTLRLLPASDLSSATLGPRVIVLTDEVPNDIPFVGGLITESFQTPLAHVNVLSQGRGTPNMALRDARSDPAIAPLIDQLVRLTVSGGGFTIELAEPADAQAFWDAQTPNGPAIAPRLDTTITDLVPLEGDTGLEALPAIGAKAAQLGELARVPSTSSRCTADIKGPSRPFAIPVARYFSHMQTSGAQSLLDQRLADAKFFSDPAQRAEDLASIRTLIVNAPVDAELLAAVDAAVSERHGNARVKFRSSSNTEDLQGFSGAGIYTSMDAERGDDSRTIEDAMRTVWASLWNDRAFDERQFARIDHSQVAMGILVHNAFLSEKANGVGISRNVLNPDRGDQHYYNLQFGEASVTNPAPGVATEQLVYQEPPRVPTLQFQAASSLAEGHVMSEAELRVLACQLGEIRNHFRSLLDPQAENPWFAMEVEFKVMGEQRALVIKQSRPYNFGSAEPVGDCREF